MRSLDAFDAAGDPVSSMAMPEDYAVNVGTPEPAQLRLIEVKAFAPIAK